MKACIFHGPGDISIESVAEPAAGPGELLLKVEATGLCHSDIRVYRGEKYARPGVIPGHEIVGVIAEVGEAVEGFHPGQRVTLCPIIACGHCYYCQRGLRNRCLTRLTLGYDENGGLAQHMVVPPRIIELGHLLALPEGLPTERATLTEPLACVLNSLETCRLLPGATLLLLGAGPMGLLHVLLARALGVAQVIVGEPSEERLQFARRLGATLAVHPEGPDLKKAVLESTEGLGADAVVITPGIPALIPQALTLVRRQGVINLFGGFPPGSHIDLDPNAIHYGEVSLTGSQNATPDQYRRALQLLSGLPAADTVNTHKFAIDEAKMAYETRLQMDGLKSLVVF